MAICSPTLWLGWIGFTLWLAALPFPILAQTASPDLTPPLAALTQPPEDKEGYIIPFSYDPVRSPVPTIQISINHSEPMAFLLDTGVSFPLIVDTWAAIKLHLLPNGHQFTLGTPDKAEVKSGYYANVSQVQALGLSSEGVPMRYALNQEGVAVVNLNLPSKVLMTYKSRIAGFVGIPAWIPFTTRLDFANKRLVVFPNAMLPLRIQGAAVLSLRARDGLYTIPVKSPKGASVDLIVDTGNTSVGLPKPFISDFITAKAPRVMVGDYDAEGLHMVDRVLIPQVALGDLMEPNVTVEAMANPNVGSMGMGLLSRFRVTLDFNHKEMVLERAANYKAHTQSAGLNSVSLIAVDKQFLVWKVSKDSTAKQAGVQIGDRLLAIDGQSADDLSFSEAQGLLDGLAGTQAHLTLERAGKQRIELTYERQDEFALPDDSHVGIGIVPGALDGGKLAVIGVFMNSPAQEAGIQAGDQIIEINGQSLGKVPLDTLHSELLVPEKGSILRCRVMRDGKEMPGELRLQAREIPG